MGGVCSPPPVLELVIAGVSKGFDQVEARRGEFVSIVGPSGCGKSTLLGIAAGLVAPSAGQIYTTGLPPGDGQPRLGMVFQEVALFPWRTALGNVAFGLEERGMPRGEREQIARRHLEMVGLRGFEQAYPHLDLPRPRREELMHLAPFNDLVARIWAIIKDEAQQALQEVGA